MQFALKNTVSLVLMAGNESETLSCMYSESSAVNDFFICFVYVLLDIFLV